MITNKPILLTGLTGYIGSHIAAQLLNRGYAVRGTMRNPAKADKITAAIGAQAPTDKLTVVRADLTDADSWTEAVAGVEYVLHVASPLMAGIPKDPNELIVPAREGTLNVLRAATAAGVKRVVITSSMAAVAYGLNASPDAPITEERWSDPDHPDNTPYVQSKTYAERAAWDFVANTPGTPELVTVNPAAVLGPLVGDNPSESLLLVSKMMQGEFPGVPKFGFGVVDVRDVADLHLRALEDPAAAGERFLASSEYLTMAQVAEVLREGFPAYRKKLPSRKLPNWLLRVVALFDADTKGVLTELNKRRVVTSAKAQRVLGWKPRPAAEAIRTTAADMIERGLI